MKRILIGILAFTTLSAFAGNDNADMKPVINSDFYPVMGRSTEKPVVIPYSKIVDSVAFALATYGGQKCSAIRNAVERNIRWLSSEEATGSDRILPCLSENGGMPIGSECLAFEFAEWLSVFAKADVGCGSLFGSRFDPICDKLTPLRDGGKAWEIKFYLYDRLTKGNAPACD